MSYVLGTIISTGHKTEKNQGRFLLFYAHVLAPFILRALRGLEKVGELLEFPWPVGGRRRVDEGCLVLHSSPERREACALRGSRWEALNALAPVQWPLSCCLLHSHPWKGGRWWAGGLPLALLGSHLKSGGRAQTRAVELALGFEDG